MNGPRDHHTKWRNPDKDQKTKIIWHHSYVECKQMIQMTNLNLNMKFRHRPWTPESHKPNSQGGNIFTWIHKRTQIKYAPHCLPSNPTQAYFSTVFLSVSRNFIFQLLSPQTSNNLLLLLFFFLFHHFPNSSRNPVDPLCHTYRLESHFTISTAIQSRSPFLSIWLQSLPTFSFAPFYLFSIQ